MRVHARGSRARAVLPRELRMIDPERLTDELVYGIAPDGKVARAARELAGSGAFGDLRISPDRTWLLASCQGSERSPYRVVIDLGGEERPDTECNCMSMKRPCKHALGLMLLAGRDLGAF